MDAPPPSPPPPSPSFPGPGPQPPTSPAGRLRAISTGTRKGLLNLAVFVMVSAFGVALAAAAFLGKLQWREAFTLGTVALGVFGWHSGTTVRGIAQEDVARFAASAPAPLTKIDASSSATQVSPAPRGDTPALDADATLDPDKPS